MPTSYALAVDLGGTKVEAALVDEQGVVLATSRHRAPTGPVKTAEELADSVRTVVTRARASLPAGDALLGVGNGTVTRQRHTTERSRCSYCQLAADCGSAA